MSDFDFRAWLNVMGLTQPQAASRLGVSDEYVSRLAAEPTSARWKPASAAIQENCRRIARERIEEIRPYTRGG